MSICRFIRNAILKGNKGLPGSFYNVIIKRHCSKCDNCREFLRTYAVLSEIGQTHEETPVPSLHLKEECLSAAAKKQENLSCLYRKKVRSFRFAAGMALILFMFSLPLVRNLLEEDSVYNNNYYVSQETIYDEYNQEFDDELEYVFQLISFLDDVDNGQM